MERRVCGGWGLGDILTVAVGEAGCWGGVDGRAAKKGRNGEESSSSSSASERGLSGGLVVE